jgi:hypothetical protein
MALEFLRGSSRRFNGACEWRQSKTPTLSKAPDLELALGRPLATIVGGLKAGLKFVAASRPKSTPAPPAAVS